MLKIFDNIFQNRIDVNFVKKTKFKNIIMDSDYQIVEICQTKEFRKKHIIFSIHMTPLNFKSEHIKLLNPNKKIVISGEWRKKVQYYRFLKYNGYKKVYLVK